MKSEYGDYKPLKDRFKLSKPITHFEDRSVLNKALEVVDVVYSEDGRVFRVTDWSPHVQAGKLVSVTIEAIIELPEDFPA
jgi:hypothetical protein